jgi:hypothetical protein
VEAAIKTDLETQLEMGVIEVSKTIYGCAVHAVSKPDSESGYRFTIDFRPVNSGVVTVPYPLPTIRAVLSSLTKCANMDLKHGY